MTLTELAEKYGTDKLQHGYIPYYEKYLPKKILSMMEIGVLKGAGVRMFDDYYNNEPEVHLLDLFLQSGNMTQREARSLGFVTHQGSQSNLSFISSITDQFDFIEEDGSHNSYDQIISFKHFFLNNLVAGGLWVTEDLHCCTDPFYWGQIKEIQSVDDTMLGLVRKFISTGGEISNPFFNVGESEVFENLIDRMELCCNDKIVFVFKK